MKMLRHMLAGRRLDAFADAELDDSEADKIRRHLDECVDCVTELELVIWTKSLLAQHPAAKEPRDSATLAQLESWLMSEVLDGS